MMMRGNFSENLKMGQWDWAIDDYNAALRINPMLTSSLYGRGLAKPRKATQPVAMQTSHLQRQSRRISSRISRATACSKRGAVPTSVAKLLRSI
jgi:hypothetical protein